MQELFKKFRKKQFVLVVGIALICLILVYVFGKSRGFFSTEETEIGLIDSTELQQEHFKYGLSLDDYTEVVAKVEKNENLSSILNQYGISAAKVQEICDKSEDVFSVRSIRAGQSYTMLITKDSLKTPEYFIYEVSTSEYVVFDLKEDSNVYLGEKPIEKRSISIKGNIESSLWNAIVEAKGNPMLAVKMSEIFQWTIDFFGIKKGDSFKVIYDESFVEGQSLNDYNIKAVVLNHGGKDYYAYKYTQDGKAEFYDEKGNSLQKAFLKAPLKYARVSSKFTNSRFHPVLKIYRAHHGVDYAAPSGTPVFSIGDGKVIKKTFQAGGGGNYITIQHNSNYKTCYMHLSRYAKGISQGTRVKQGQIIGYVGQTGIATGPHLDFRVYMNGTPIDPLKIKSPTKTPISKSHKADFLAMEKVLEEQLINL